MHMHTPTMTSKYDPLFIQCIYRYSHASKRFVEVYICIYHVPARHDFCIFDLFDLILYVPSTIYQL